LAKIKTMGGDKKRLQKRKKMRRRKSRMTRRNEEL
jgi:hypothetical protein